MDDADKLDGLDSTAYGRTFGRTAAVGATFTGGFGSMGGFLDLFYTCSGDPSTQNGALIIWNVSGNTANVFVDSGAVTAQYNEMTAGESWTLPAEFGGDSFRIQAQGPLGVMTVNVATIHRTDDCHGQALGVFAPS